MDESSTVIQTELLIVALITGLVLLGSIARSIAKQFKFPFTVLMLILGLGTGVFLKNFPSLLEKIGLASGEPFLDPHLITFVFLPILIFESALSLNAHIFKKSMANISILAFPALLMCTGLTAAFAMYAIPEGWGWTWELAILFGVLISATDPVAVVAILRELGISKRIVTVIEGESLLNDGVAIVLFYTFLAIVTGQAKLDYLGIFTDAIRVISGGLIIGLILAAITSFWIGRIFNDPLIEIPLTLALAYSAMIIPEQYHLSGIMAVVIAGLWMASKGRTKISPEVHHSMHDFWGLLGNIANTLIFFLVGFAITFQISSITWSEVGIIILIYIAIMVIRLSTILFMWFPLSKTGDNLSLKDKLAWKKISVYSWGGLRGAVSLALALTVSQAENISPTIRDQILLITSGVVVLTILINGTTMKNLLSLINLNESPLGKRKHELSLSLSTVNNLREFADQTTYGGGFKGVTWKEANNYIESRSQDINNKIEDLNKKLSVSDDYQHESVIWNYALNKERAIYWKLFNDGVFNKDALTILDHQIDIHFDLLNEGTLKAPENRVPDNNKGLEKISRLFKSSKFFTNKLNHYFENEMKLNYHLHKAVSRASAAIIKSLNNYSDEDNEVKKPVIEQYQTYMEGSQEEVEEMRENLEEVVHALEQHSALRVILNEERTNLIKHYKNGEIEEDQLKISLEKVEDRIKEHQKNVSKSTIPESKDLIKEVPLFQHSSYEAQGLLADKAVEIFKKKDDFLFKEGDKGDSLYIVVRGYCKILITSPKDGSLQQVASLHTGDIIGEMALLTGQPRTASVQAGGTVTLLKITKFDFEEICKSSPKILDETWKSYGLHSLDNLLRSNETYKDIPEEEREMLVKRAQYKTLRKEEKINPNFLGGIILLLSGIVNQDNKEITVMTPERINDTNLTATTESRVVLLTLLS